MFKKLFARGPEQGSQESDIKLVGRELPVVGGTSINAMRSAIEKREPIGFHHRPSGRTITVMPENSSFTEESGQSTLTIYGRTPSVLNAEMNVQVTVASKDPNQDSPKGVAFISTKAD
jgi:hypothetical protein